jgi:isopentenyl-diphosphate delta-isomerase
VKPEALDREIAESPDRFTPWLKMEWQRLRGEFADRLPGRDGPPRHRREA